MSDFLLIDVRTPEEFVRDSVAGARLVPLAELEDKASLLFAEVSSDTPVYVFCKSGYRSEIAKNYLCSLGLNAFNLGGLSEARVFVAENGLE